MRIPVGEKEPAVEKGLSVEKGCLCGGCSVEKECSVASVLW